MFLLALCTIFSVIFWKLTNKMILVEKDRPVSSIMIEALISATGSTLIFYLTVKLGEYLVVLNKASL